MTFSLTLSAVMAQQNDEVSIFKLIVPILIALFWLITQILASVAEKKKKRSPPDTIEIPPISTEPEKSVPQPGPPPKRVPQAPRQGRPRPPVRQPQRTMGQPKPPPLTARPNKPQPLTTPPVHDIETSSPSQASAPILSSSPLATTEIGSSLTTSHQGPDRMDRLRAILRPANLRKEFILTEILQPPVGLRSDPSQ